MHRRIEQPAASTDACVNNYLAMHCQCMLQATESKTEEACM